MYHSYAMAVEEKQLYLRRGVRDPKLNHALTCLSYSLQTKKPQSKPWLLYIYMRKPKNPFQGKNPLNMGNYNIFYMFKNSRRGRKPRNFTTNVPKILDLKLSSEQIFSENWRWVTLRKHLKMYVWTLPVGLDKLYLTWVRMADPFWNRCPYVLVMIFCTIFCWRRSHLIKIFSRDTLNAGKTVKARF